MRREVPLHRSLLPKFMVLAALVSACSIAATAWLTVHITAVAIRQEQGQALADDARIYDALLGYAATHHDWAGAAATLHDLARESGHRITLTDENRRVLLDSADPEAGGTPTTPQDASGGRTGPDLPSEASATVDPLAADTALVAGGQALPPTARSGGTAGTEPGTKTGTKPEAEPETEPKVKPGYRSGQVGEASPGPTCAPGTRCPTGGPPPSSAGQPSDAGPSPYADLPNPTQSTIDARAVGPFRLTAGERTTLHSVALRISSCLRDRLHLAADVTETPTGRSVLQTAKTVAYLPTDCPTTGLDEPTATEKRALSQLDGLVDTCLDRRGAPPVRLNLDFGWVWSGTATGTRSGAAAAVPTPQAAAAVAPCVETGRREQLAPYVAPPALLFVSSPRRAAATFLDLSTGNRARIAEVTGLVLLLTLTVTALAGTRMIRPLRALAGAARRMTDGDLTARVRVRAGDEIGQVAAAFNTMSERRAQSEGLRKAMANDVAHELRTPLSNIRGWLEAAEDGLVVPDRALLGSLLDEAVLLQHVIDDLRDLAAADAGELRLHTGRLDPVELLGQVATAHRGSADAVGVTLITTVGALPAVVADPVRLRQAIGNLVSNAVRHTPPGGTVTLRARSEDGRAVIEVADTGSGIAPDDLPRVFDRFWRAEKSRSRQTGGSGLGLSIVRKIAEAHGGTAAASSVLGSGSVFVLTLPVTPPGTPAGARR